MFFKHKVKSKSGFTLIELLVVTAVISVLVGGLIILLNPSAQFGKVNDAKRKSDLNQIQKALEIYYQDNNFYPDHTIGDYEIVGAAWNESWSNYMAKVPGDQIAGRKYVYYSTGQSYFLYAYLESLKDRHMCFPDTGLACSSWIANSITNNCGGICNYGVSSPNVRP